MRASVLFWPSLRERPLSAMALAEGGSAFTLDQDDHSDLLEGHQVSLPELLGFSKEFQEALDMAGGCCHTLAAKLLDSHSSENSNFVAGRLGYTREQKEFYIKTLDFGPTYLPATIRA